MSYLYIKHLKVNLFSNIIIIPQVTLQCDSASSNPEAEITWWRNGFKIESARYNGSQNGVYGGKAARSILKIDTTPSHDNAVYTCQATNKALQHSVHDAVTLNVLCMYHRIIHQI